MQHGEQGYVGGNGGAALPLGQGLGVNYYHVLDVPIDASRLVIREAYLRLKNAYGTGSAALYSLMNEEEASEQIAQIEAAFRVLSDEVARRAYDHEVSIGGVRQDSLLGHSLLGGAAASRGDGAGLGGGSDGDSLPLESSGQPLEATIRTHRSTLPVIKLRAPSAGDDEVQAKLKDIIAGGDPGDGDLLRRLREACGVTEDEICERTKVSIGYIHAIEANRFERLPQAVFVKGFLRSYCRYLAVPDAETFVSAFSARLLDWQSNRKS